MLNILKKNKDIKKVIVVDGMHCVNCANKVIESLITIGASKVKINLKKKEVTIFSKKEIENDLIELVINNLEFKYMGVK